MLAQAVTLLTVRQINASRNHVTFTRYTNFVVTSLDNNFLWSHEPLANLYLKTSNCRFAPEASTQ